jgi:hypothetical protein
MSDRCPAKEVLRGDAMSWPRSTLALSSSPLEVLATNGKHRSVMTLDLTGSHTLLAHAVRRRNGEDPLEAPYPEPGAIP